MEMPDYPGQKVMVVGRGVMALRQCYDPDQLWLDLGDVFLFPHAAETKPPARKKPPIRKHPFAVVPDGCRAPYVYEKDVPQFVLPFAEYRGVSNKDWKRLIDAGHPGWDRWPGGDGDRLLSIPIRNFQTGVAPGEWCQQNCRGRFFVKPSYLVFEREMDCLLGRMMFS
jgi:hypothetical protein